MTGLIASAGLVLVIGYAVYPYLPTGDGDQPSPRGRSRWWFDDLAWDWPLDPTLDRSTRAGACRRRFQPRVPDGWDGEAIVHTLTAASAAGIDYAFGDNVYGDLLRNLAGWLNEIELGGFMIGSGAVAGPGFGITRAPGESDDAFYRRAVLALRKAAGHER